MGIDIRLPQITAVSERDQLTQVKSYLYQLATQLQWALKNVDTTTNVVVTPTPKSLLPTSESHTVDATATFGSIKSLIIKSADIVEAYYKEINKELASIYVASSDFGTFKQQMEQEISATSEGIEQNFTNLQEISKSFSNEVAQLDTELKEAKGNLDSELQVIKNDLDSITYSLIAVSANIKSGLLYYDENEVPVYGLEIGQRNYVNGEEVFNKFARFTAGRLSFYDQNGFEVAYISDYKIYITHAEVTGTLKLGGYLIDTTNGLTFKWVGRS